VSDDERLSFDVLAGRMTVDVSDSATTSADILSAVARTGMHAQLLEGQRPSVIDPHRTAAWRRGAWVTALSGGFWLAGLILQIAAGQLSPAGSPAVVAWSCLLLAVVVGLWLVVPKAARAAWRLQPDMNLLMTIAVIGAVILGEYLEAATVAFLFALSNALEAWSIRRAHRAIQSLMDLAPPMARVLSNDGKEQTRHIEDVPIGSRLVVKPGERIPLDGTVLAGTSHVNQAPITGEACRSASKSATACSRAR
jgi:Cd2+/Zn2+-exporting ATPase